MWLKVKKFRGVELVSIKDPSLQGNKGGLGKSLSISCLYSNPTRALSFTQTKIQSPNQGLKEPTRSGSHLDISRSKPLPILFAYTTPVTLASSLLHSTKSTPASGPLHPLFPLLEHTTTKSLLILSERPSVVTQFTHTLPMLYFSS